MSKEETFPQGIVKNDADEKDAGNTVRENP